MAASRLVTADVTGADLWSPPVVARIGAVYVRVGGTYTGLVKVQRSHDDGANWETVTVIPPGAASRHVENAVHGAWYRAGFAAGATTTGTANVELAQ